MRSGVTALTVVFVEGIAALVWAQTRPTTQATAAPSAKLALLVRQSDPYGWPRPAKNATDVPLRTSIYFLVGVEKVGHDRILPDSVTVKIRALGEKWTDLLQAGRHFVGPASGYLRVQQARQDSGRTGRIAVYVDPGRTLKPETTYFVRVSARSRGGAELAARAGTWRFTTEAAPAMHPVNFKLNLSAKPVRWHGGFFTGFCGLGFCTDAKTYGPTDAMMAKARQRHPRAWSLIRTVWMMTSDEIRQGWMLWLNPRLPNIVRERETRRITAVEKRQNGVLLHVEDFFGHSQYGMAGNRPLSEDYHKGDEVLVSDGVSDARAKVLSVDDEAHTVMLDRLAEPAQGWRINYRTPLPRKEDPDAPGLFAVGGCYLRKFKPHGTPCYYWGRLNKELDLSVGRYNRRLIVNFFDAPAALSVTGRGANTAKDLVEWHEVVRTITGHIIDRYGEKSLHFFWSVFNEPDLQRAFWNPSWDELQRFYDYTVDAVLRAFEDRGYDSSRVMVGGLELGAIFGTHLRLNEFLAHCSPTATAKGSLPLNAAFADARLDGRRSKRVEALCRAHDGRGSPCDFISIHTYNRSELAAAKLIRAKEMALAMDPEYYRHLWINSHESCPSWNRPPDEAAEDSYLGNGYYPSWCADVAARQVRKAAQDPRYAYGETILTTWPPASNFAGQNAFTRMINTDDDGDGVMDRKVTVPMPIFNALGLLSDLGDRYWALPERKVGGHAVSGFASRDDKGVIRVMVYSHNMQDTQSRSDAEFAVTVELNSVGFKGPARVREYRFDRAHNTYYRQAKELKDRPLPGMKEIKAALKDLNSKDPKTLQKALESLRPHVANILRRPDVLDDYLPLILAQVKSDDEGVRKAAEALIERAKTLAGKVGEVYSRQEVEEIQRLACCHATATSTASLDPKGRLKVTTHLTANGVSFLVIEPGTGANW